MKDNRIISHIEQLRKLASDSEEHLFLQMVNYDGGGGGEELMRCIQECALNILSENVPLTKAEISYLFRHKELVRAIGKKHVSVKILKRLLTSHSKIIPHLIRPVLRLYKINPSM